MIIIDQIKLPMQYIDNLPSSNKEALSYQNRVKNDEPKATELETQQVVKILDVNYEKADLPEFVKNNCTNSRPSEQAKLLEVLEEFEELFDRTLGVWDTEPVTFELREGAEPYHGRAFPIPVVHTETIMTEIKRLTEIGVLE